MRTIHTNNTVCGYSHEVSVGAVGRLHHSCEDPHINPVPIDPIKGTGPYRILTKHDIMRKSLFEGITYFSMQLKGLSKTEGIIKEASRLNNSYLSTIDESVVSARKFLKETLSVVTSENFRKHPLFGFGHETPLRLHLNIDSKRSMYPLPVVPLLGKASFRSLGISLGIGESVGSGICQESLQEIISLMLDVQIRKDELTELSHKVFEKTPLLNHGKSFPKSRVPEFFKNMKSKFYKHSKLILPRSLPEVPI